MKDINWAVLGTGVIANEMAVALKKNGKNIYAVGNRTYEKAVAFGEKYGIGKVYVDYNEMFTDPEVDVIYITTPQKTHKKFIKSSIKFSLSIFNFIMSLSKTIINNFNLFSTLKVSKYLTKIFTFSLLFFNNSLSFLSLFYIGLGT